MKALWPLEKATVREIFIVLSDRCPRAYTTILTILDRLARKKIVIRQKHGTAWVYRPNLSAARVRADAVRRLLDGFFDGSPEALVRFLGSGKTVTDRPGKQISKHR